MSPCLPRMLGNLAGGPRVGGRQLRADFCPEHVKRSIWKNRTVVKKLNLSVAVDMCSI